MGRPKPGSAKKRKRSGGAEEEEADGGTAGATAAVASPSAPEPQPDGEGEAAEPSGPSDGGGGDAAAGAGDVVMGDAAADVAAEGAAAAETAAPAAEPPAASPAVAPAATRKSKRKSSAAAAAAAAATAAAAAPSGVDGDAAIAAALQQAAAAEETGRHRSARQKSGKYRENRIEYEWERENYREGSSGGRRRRGSGGRERGREAAAAAAAEPEPEAEQEDKWDTHCKVCASDEDAQKLLCCDGMEAFGCTSVYHMYCLDPPLARLPPGDWFCPGCAHKFSYQDIERVLDVREVPVSPKPDGEAEATPAPEHQLRREYHIKWKGESYMHCTWEPEEELGKVYKLLPAVKAKVQRFWKLRDSREAEEREAEEAGEYVHGVNSLWLEVERILAEQPAEAARQAGGRGKKAGGGKGQMEYLVKWRELGYDQCTWEVEGDISGYEAAIQRFREHKSVAEDARARKAAASSKDAAKDAAPARKRARKDEPAAGTDGGPSVPSGAAGGGESAKKGDEAAAQVQGSGSRKWTRTPSFLSGGQLHPYQLEGLNWLYHKYCTAEAVILADEMGLGKTVQTISFLAALHAESCELPHLVVVPLSTMRNWEREFAAWAPDLNVVSLAGNAEARGVILEYELFVQPHSGNKLGRRSAAAAAAAAALAAEEGNDGKEGVAATGAAGAAGAGSSGGGGSKGSKSRLPSQQDRAKFHVLLTSYEMLALEAGPLSRGLQYGVLVVDEGHRLKNKDSKLFQLLNQFDVKHKVLLTGTPLQNHIGELFMLLHFLEPAKFPSRAAFESRFANLNHNDEVAALHALLQPHMLRRLKKDVMQQLPPKMEQLVRVELSPQQKEIYKSLLLRHSSVLVGNRAALAAAGGAVSALKNLMMELRKTCNHPFLVNQQAGRDPGHPTDLDSLISFSGKLQLVDKMASRLRDAGHRLIIFSQFTRTLDILEEWLVGRELGYLRIDGTVSGAERQKRIDRFNQQPDAYFCFLLSTRAGGLGINLATADTVIIFDSDWNPHNDLQAQARAHRLGQDKPVMIYRLVTRQTIEERMMQVSRKKMMLEHLVVRKMSSGGGGELKQSELDDILRYGAQELFAEDEAPAAGAAGEAGAKPEGAAEGTGDGAAGDDGAQAGTEPVAAATDGAGGEGAADGKSAAEGSAEQTGGEGVAGGSAAAGGSKSKRIVWDDAAIDRLLDRQALNAMRNYGESSAADEAGADLFSAFKVANFDMVEVAQEAEGEEEEGERAAAAGEGAVPEQLLAELCPDQGGEAGPAFWHSLLGGHAELAAEDAAALQRQLLLQQQRMGKGRRQRKKVSYRDAAAEEDLSTDGSYTQSEEPASDSDSGLGGEPDGAEGGGGRPSAKRLRHAPSGGLAGAASGPLGLAHSGGGGLLVPHGAAAGGAGILSVGGGVAPAPPLVSGSGPGLLVCGLTQRDRQTFIAALMRFGLQVSESNPDEMYRAFAQRLPHRPAAWVREYCNTLIGCVSEPVGPNGTWPNGLRPEDLLGAHKTNDVLERIGFMHLVRRKMAEWCDRPLAPDPQRLPGDKAPPGPAPRGFELPCASRVRGLHYSGHWRPHHDGFLLRGLLLYGYGQWQRLIRDSSLGGLKEALRGELGIPLDYDANVGGGAAGTQQGQQGQPAASPAAAAAATVKDEQAAAAHGAATETSAPPPAKEESPPAEGGGVAESEKDEEGKANKESEDPRDPEEAKAEQGAKEEGERSAVEAAAQQPEGVEAEAKPAAPEVKQEAEGDAKQAAAPAPEHPAQATSPAAAAASPAPVSKERARAYASNESRWLTRRLGFISEALNSEYLANPLAAANLGLQGQRSAAAAATPPAAAPTGSVAAAAAAGAAGLQRAAMALYAQQQPGGGRTSPSLAAAAAAAAAAAIPDGFMANLLPLSVLEGCAAASPADRLVRRQMLEAFNGLVRCVATIRYDTAQAAQRAAVEGGSALSQAAARFRQQVSLLETISSQMLLSLPPTGRTVAQAAPGIIARAQQAAAAQQQQQAQRAAAIMAMAAAARGQQPGAVAAAAARVAAVGRAASPTAAVTAPAAAAAAAPDGTVVVRPAPAEAPAAAAPVDTSPEAVAAVAETAQNVPEADNGAALATVASPQPTLEASEEVAAAAAVPGSAATAGAAPADVAQPPAASTGPVAAANSADVAEPRTLSAMAPLFEKSTEVEMQDVE